MLRSKKMDASSGVQIGDSPEFADILGKFANDVPAYIDCGAGWSNLIRECHEAIMEHDEDYRILQVKEKFGGLRFYFTPSTMDMYVNLCSAVFAIEEKSFSICEICGSDAYKRRTDYGLIYTSCDEHAISG